MPSPSQGNDFNSSPVSPSAPIQPAQTAPPSATPAGPSIRPVVSNTTPLITLGEIGLLDALRQLYGAVWIPTTVLIEYQRGLPAHPNRPDLLALSWMRAQQASNDPLVPASLDAGERDAIALARAQQASRILLDERAARAVAARLNLTVTGSAGVLLAAKQVGIIPLVKPYLDGIVAQGRYLSSRVYEQVLRQAGE